MRKYENLLQIGEVAQLYAISRKMLLNYEKNGLLSPTKLDRFSGYRYYDSYAVARVGLILDLRRAGMSIPDICKYMNGKITVSEQIARLQAQIAELQSAVTQLEMRNLTPGALSEVTETVLPAQKAVFRDMVVSDTDAAVSAFTELFGECVQNGCRFGSGDLNFCEFTGDPTCVDFYRTEEIRMRVCISVKDAGNIPKSRTAFYPATRAVTVSYCGSYHDGAAAYAALRSYLLSHSLTVSGATRELYLQGGFNNSDTDNLVCIAVPVV